MAILAEHQAVEACYLIAENRMDPADKRNWEAVSEGAGGVVIAILESCSILADLGPLDINVRMDMPDLNGIGVRMCVSCGCTDRHGCAAGCWWVSETLCSECAPRDGRDLRGASHARPTH